MQKKIQKEAGQSSHEFQESILQQSQDSESFQDENRPHSQSYIEKLQYLNFLKELEITVFQQQPTPSAQRSDRNSQMKEPSLQNIAKDDTGFTFLKPPDQNQDFYVSTGFRLWISIDYSFIQAAKCPPSLLAASNKIMIEYEQDLKGITGQILSSTSNELFSCCQEFATQYRLAYFAMSFLHALLIGKTQYLSLGWKVPYSFSMNDHQIASFFNLQLLKSCNCNENLSVKSITTLQYYLGDIIYGARMESLEDRNSLSSLITQLINQQSLVRDTQESSKIKPYNLTGIQDSQDEFINHYKMPLSLNLDFIEANLQKFPVIDRPEVFGISSQIQKFFLQKKGETLLERIYAIQCADTRIKTQIALQNQGISSHEDDLAAAEVFQIDLKRQKTKLLDALYKIPDPLEFPVSLKSQNITCFALIIKKEVQLYNNLIKELTNRLKELIFCLETQSQMSINMEAEFFQIQQDITPNSWITISYPAFSVLPSYLINLQDRTSYIAELLESPQLDEQHIFNFWLPGFYDPKCFFSLLKQHEAQKQKIPLDQIFFQFDVFQNDNKSSSESLSSRTLSAKDQTQLKRNETQDPKTTQNETSQLITTQPKKQPNKIFQTSLQHKQKNSYLIFGLHLQCGFWDGTCIKDLAQPKQSQTNQDQAKLVTHFPAIILQTSQDSSLYLINQEKTKARAFNEDHYQFPYWIEEEIVDANQNKYYMVPVYITQDRDRLPKTKLNYGGLIMRIPLRTDNQEQKYFWAKRGLALLCHVEE